MLEPEQIAAYREWFQKPAAPTAVGAFQQVLAGLKPVTNAGDARMQVLTLSQFMHLSPSSAVQEIGREVKQSPDGLVGEALTRLHTKITNPLDFVVYLHSPACRHLISQIAPKFFEKPEDAEFVMSDEDTVIV